MSNKNVRLLVKELLENEYLIVNYNESNDGGFDLSVRINEEKFNTLEKINKIMDERLVEFKRGQD